MRTEPNAYSRQWFEFFHFDIDEERTEREVAFICHSAPLPAFRKVGDVNCGIGRHVRALSCCGYSVIGIDRDPQVIAKARELGGGPRYFEADIRTHQFKPGEFDVAIVMGQSFGYFDAETNAEMLRRLSASVRPAGRVILDLWNPEFFASHHGEHELKTQLGTVQESKRVVADRLFVDLKYPDDSEEKFEWQLFSPSQMEQLAKSAGLAMIHACTDFDSRNVPHLANPRIQFVLERA